uniref:Receptor-like serine/threonine-protein kinase n=2 Tax=Setaria italica TaxID=4555 RepID=K3Y2W4_SETIT
MAAVLWSAPLARVPFLAALLLVLLQQARLPPLAAARTNLTAGATLAPPDYITSPSGAFAFGFRALDSDPAKFILATWFRFGDGNGDSSSQPQPQSVVWFAKQLPSGATPNATARSVLSVTADGELTLTDGGSNQALWAPSTERGSVLALRDSGNLQFLSDSGDQVLWESFSYPTDTLLPGQSLVYAQSGNEGKVFAKRADAEFTTGRFSMGVQSDGNVVLYVDLLKGNDPGNAYWQAYTNSPDGNTTVTFDGQGRLNYTLHNGTTQSLIQPASSFAAGDYFQFARMDLDGIVRTYIRPKNGGAGNTSWTVSGAFPDNGCHKWTSGLQGMCGPGSYCMSALTKSSRDRLSCVCPSGYNYTDEQHRDSGCTPAFEPQSCDGKDSSDDFTLVELLNTTWEASIYYKKFPSVTEDQCREYCLSDCFCAAALFIDGSDCAEVAALTNGWQANDGTILTTKALIKVRTRNPPQIASSRTRNALAYKVIAICLAFLLLITVGGLVAHHFVTRNRESQRLLSPSVRSFSWKELHQATNGFEKLLGKGSFGEVYKGTIRSPQPHPIAVKKLINSNDYSEQEFTNEVQSIGQIHHRNLVRMIGYCKEGKHRMLVFEFMPGGSLRGFLFNPEKRPPWRWRAEAALAIARGLEYLHDGCSAPIIHCDIKPDNILLDDLGVPRITDFGISKLLGNQQVHTTVTHVRGTRGYIAPEWLRGDARVDTKADVYSFGVVLLEMICCRKCHEPVTPEGAEDDDDETVTLFGWAAQLVGARRTEVMLRGDADVDTVEDMERVERFARVALSCIEPNPLLRPTMHQVVQMLETSKRQVEALPDPPVCYIEGEFGRAPREGLL